METFSQLILNRVYQSEYGCTDAEKSQSTVAESHSYILQIPSQFQNSSNSSRKAAAANLVKNPISAEETHNKARSSPKDDVVASPGNDELAEPQNTRFNTPDSCYQNAGRRDDIVVVDEKHAADDSGFVSGDNELTRNTGSPNVISTVQCSSVKHRTTILERLTNSRPGRSNVSGHDKDDEGNRGIVLNLKKEFEAKCNVHEKSKQRKKCSSQGDDNNNEDARSLPSSPVTEHTRNRNFTKPSSAASTEDLSVRKLVGKYEIAKGSKDKKYDKRQPPIPPRKSSLDINLPQSRFGVKHASNVFTQYNRGHRGVAPIVKSFLSTPNEIRSTVTKAANMLQQGKAHPLSKLNFCKQRNAPPVYNTM